MDNEENLSHSENTNIEEDSDNTEYYEFSKMNKQNETSENPEVTSGNSSDTENSDSDEDAIRLMIVTADNIIAGDLQVPVDVEISEDDTDEDILFRVLNCGNQFLALRASSIMDRDNTEFEPERIPYFIVNTDIIETCRIVPDRKR